MSGASAMTRCSSQPYRWRIRSKASRSSGRNLPPTGKVSPTSMGRDPDRTYSGNGRSPVSSPTSTRRPSASAFTVFCRGVPIVPDSIRAIWRSVIRLRPHARASCARLRCRHSRMALRRSETSVILLFLWIMTSGGECQRISFQISWSTGHFRTFVRGPRIIGRRWTCTRPARSESGSSPASGRGTIGDPAGLWADPCPPLGRRRPPGTRHRRERH